MVLSLDALVAKNMHEETKDLIKFIDNVTKAMIDEDIRNKNLAKSVEVLYDHITKVAPDTIQDIPEFYHPTKRWVNISNVPNTESDNIA